MVLHLSNFSVVITTREKEMAKRFMSNCFEKKWFRELPIRLKIVWFYLLNKCNHAGILDDLDLDLLSFQIGEEYTLKEILEAFGDNLKEIGEGKIFITKFIDFQYGELNPSVRVHQSVIKLLQKHNIELDKSLTSVNDKLLSVKDKDKSKDIDIEKRKENFAKRIEKEVADMNVPAKDIQDFISYWSEHNTDGRVMRFEKQDIFNVKRRMSTWITNSKKFASNLTFQPVSDEDIEKKEAQLEKEYQDQQQRFKDADANVATDDDRKKALGIK